MLLLGSLPFLAKAGEPLKGMVLGNEDGQEKPLADASLHWSNSTIGTITDEKGHFGLERVAETSMPVASYTGYLSETLDTKDMQLCRIVLRLNTVLDEAVLERGYGNRPISCRIGD
ncbi:MAG: hypothetical protein GC180_00530 [Bacteroidetes bacterium]|nr:hypothetical protein [Bacteroidota bacterium]